MSNHARKRLIRDFRKLQTDPPHGVSGAPVANDIMRWNAVIFGPEDTPWEGGTFQLEIIFSNEYPNRPPVVRFLSKLFHPNVYNDGNICLDILQTQWSPIYDISAILTSIQSLLSDPNPSSPANQEAARLYAENRREYHRRVQQCVNESWAGVPTEAGGGGEKKRGAALAAAPSAETSENEGRRRGAEEEGGGASSSSSSAAPAAAVGTAASSFSSSSSSSSSTAAPPSTSSFSTAVPHQPSAGGGEAARNDAHTRERNTAEEATDSSATQEAAAVPPTPSTAGGVD